MHPYLLEPNQPATFYRGSGRLGEFRGLALEARPEDWVGSTTSRFGEDAAGRSELTPGRLLGDAIAAEPEAWLGDTRGLGAELSDSGLLVKLLDAGQRLPLHVHPSRDFARSHLASPYGKTEAWIVLDAKPGAVVNMGWVRDVDREELTQFVSAQRVAELLDLTHQVPVSAGDGVLCPAGMPHAIGEDILLVELQEPSDFSVMLEWDGFPISRDDAFLGMSMSEALSCVDRTALSPERLAELRMPASGSLLPAAAAKFFRAEPFSEGSLDAGFAVLVCASGTGAISGPWGSLPLRRGETLVVPFAAGPCRITGSVAGIRCRPAASRPR